MSILISIHMPIRIYAYTRVSMRISVHMWVLAPFVGTGKPRCFVTNKCKSFWKRRNKQLVNFEFNYPTATRPCLVWCCWDGQERIQRTIGARAPKEQQRAQGGKKDSTRQAALCMQIQGTRPLTRMKATDGRQLKG